MLSSVHIIGGRIGLIGCSPHGRIFFREVGFVNRLGYPQRNPDVYPHACDENDEKKIRHNLSAAAMNQNINGLKMIVPQKII